MPVTQRALAAIAWHLEPSRALRWARLARVCAVAVMLLSAAAAAWTVKRAADGSAAVLRAHLALKALGEYRLAIQAVEVGTRGYVITGDEGFLQPHTPGIARVREVEDSLAGLLMGNPLRTRRLAATHAQVAEFEEAALHCIAERRAGRVAAAVAYVSAGVWEQRRLEILSGIETVTIEERRLLALQNAAALRQTRAAFVFSAMGILVSLALTLAVFAVLAREIGARQAVEADLRTTARRHNELFDLMPVAAWEVDARPLREAAEAADLDDGNESANWCAEQPEAARAALAQVRIHAANQAALALFGAESGQDLAVSLGDIFTAAGAITGLVGELRDLAAGLTSSSRELQLRSAAGEDLTVLAQAARRTAPAGGNPALAYTTLLTFTDISARHKLEEELERYFSSSQDLFCVAGFDGFYKRLNHAWSEVLGWSTHELMAVPFLQFVHPDDVERTTAEAGLAILGQTTHQFENQFRCADGTYRWLSWSATPVVDRCVVYATARDITARRTLEDSLARDKAVADESSLAKSAFLANMTHELRTPLNAILGFSQIMAQDPTLSSAHQKRLDIINRSGEHLLTLINNVLQMSRLEAGREEVALEAVDLHGLLDDLAQLLGPQATSKRLTLSVDWAEEVPPLVSTDGRKLRQVLINLVGNAIKYTTTGGVVLRARLGSPGRLRFEVVDTGPGINPEVAASLFEPFARGHETSARVSGTGLGLAIARRYVSLMGGELTVSGSAGSGSTFRFDVPLVPATSVVPALVGSGRVVSGLVAGQQRFRILVADDQPSNRLLLAAVLEPLKLHVREAANGREAVEIAREWHPDLIFMDIRMPGLQGDVAAARIREVQGPAPVLVAVTASAYDEERTDVLSAGFDAFVRKPLRVDLVYVLLARHLGLRYTYQDELPPVLVAVALDSEHLAALPEELVRQLHDTALATDLAEVERAVDKVRSLDPALARALEERLVEFDFGAIVAATSVRES